MINDADAVVPDAEAAPRPTTGLNRLAFLVGGGGLLFATATDALAVLGRHTGVRLLGSIELVQVSVVLIASSAMIGATIQRTHASVHIFTERMAAVTAVRLARGAALLGALLFLLFATGSLIVLVELWNSGERTELLGLPLRWIRMIWVAAALVVVGLFLRQAFSRERRA